MALILMILSVFPGHQHSLLSRCRVVAMAQPPVCLSVTFCCPVKMNFSATGICRVFYLFEMGNPGRGGMWVGKICDFQPIRLHVSRMLQYGTKVNISH